MDYFPEERIYQDRLKKKQKIQESHNIERNRISR